MSRCGCSCGPSTPHACASGFSRRDFLISAGTAVGGLAFARAGLGAEAPPEIRPAPRTALKVQPVLTYELPVRREQTSWRSWGGIQTAAQLKEEEQRILKELVALTEKVDFPLELLPLKSVRTGAEGAAVAGGDHDVMLIYGAGGPVSLLETLTKPGKWNLMFLRHDPGPAYLWYEIVHPRFLRKTVDDYGQPGWDVHDVVVDEYPELLWRLRALAGLKNTLGRKVICIGGADGWGNGGRTAPDHARQQWKMDLVDCSYDELGRRIAAARKDEALVRRCTESADAYLDRRHVKLETKREYVQRAFLLADVFRGLMREAGTDAITVNNCMGTIMKIAETTACFTLSTLNDTGWMAFCESDFVVIPSGILLRQISNLPVFLNDPTLPHGGVVTLAHCTAPRRMDGKRDEPVRVLTHFESDYGAAPKVEMRLGQRCTNLVPDFNNKGWTGFAGTIIANPFHDICRSQVDVRIEGDAEKLLEQMKGFHWMMSYGDYLRECGYALRKVGIAFDNVSAKPA